MPASAKGIDQDELIAQAIKFDHDMAHAHASEPKVQPPALQDGSAAPYQASSVKVQPNYDKMHLLTVTGDPDLFLITR
jgi:predicted phage-related endonuclease